MEWNRSESERVGHDCTTPVPGLRRAHRGAEGAGGRRCLEHLRSRTVCTVYTEDSLWRKPRSVRHRPRRYRGVFAPEVEARAGLRVPRSRRAMVAKLLQRIGSSATKGSCTAARQASTTSPSPIAIAGFTALARPANVACRYRSKSREGVDISRRRAASANAVERHVVNPALQELLAEEDPVETN